MDGLSEIERHFWLTRSVARTVGISLGEAMTTGRLSAKDYSRMVTNCREAGCASRCAEWLGGQRGGQASAPPPFCVHADQLKALRFN